MSHHELNALILSDLFFPAVLPSFHNCVIVFKVFIFLIVIFSEEPIASSILCDDKFGPVTVVIRYYCKVFCLHFFTK